MNIGRTLCLAMTATFAGHVYAEGCSGGPDGGTDPSGNQCNTPTAYVVVAPINGPASNRNIARYALAPAVATASTATATSAKPVAPAIAATTKAEPRDRIAKPVVSESAPVRTAKIDSNPGGTCSGGSGGGMDATGNQCNSDSPAPEATILAQRAGR